MHRSRSLVLARLLLVLATLGAQGCASTSSFRNQTPSSDIGKLYAHETESWSPCRDSLFLVLRAQPLDSLSERQLRYMLQKDRECADYQNVHHQGGDAAGAVLGGIIIGVLVTILIAAASVSHTPWYW